MKGNQPRGGRGLALAAFALGATAGSMLALLFAPASGRVTRKRLAQSVCKFQRVGLRKIGQATHVLAAKVGDAKEAATEWISEHVNGKHVTRHRA